MDVYLRARGGVKGWGRGGGGGESKAEYPGSPLTAIVIGKDQKKRRHTHWQACREAGKRTYSGTRADKQADIYRPSSKQTDRQAGRQAHWVAETVRRTYTGAQASRHTSRQAGTLGGRDRQADMYRRPSKQTDRLADMTFVVILFPFCSL